MGALAMALEDYYEQLALKLELHERVQTLCQELNSYIDHLKHPARTPQMDKVIERLLIETVTSYTQEFK